MKRYVLSRPLLFVLLLSLVACGGQSAASTPPPTEPPTVAAVLPEPEVAEPIIAPVEVTVAPTAETMEMETAVTNAVTVSDQNLTEEFTVTIDSVTADVPGWIVIHAQADGRPGPVLGYTPVAAGENQNVIVTIDPTGATETLYAMLHIDAGTRGEYEFPGDDVPAMDADGNMVTPPFTLLGGLPVTALLQLAESDELGVYLVDAAGMALYTFAHDTPGVSNCYDACALAWPPLVVAAGEDVTAVAELPGELATTERTDGTIQVTYDGWPLYYWVNDAAPGETTGHNFRNIWAVARPTTKVLLGGNEELGRFLVGPEGLTLYRFNPDDPGISNCYDECAFYWPPLLLDEGEALTGGAGVVGKLGTTERDDGTVQVTYGGMPLYYWILDENPGDATGQAVDDVWYVVPPYTVAVSSTPELGDFLVAHNGMTLYLFGVDGENESTCYDQCAINWPPLLLEPGELPIAGFGVTGELGITERTDGTLQVTYNGYPLYFWIHDEAPGDTTGQGVNDVWFVVEP
ncbi:MAG: hypothetical protein HND44_18065 [Chloroflexi bacterium]|nr:hypothetical protein [Ardenticatenaceae bacterium]MBL1130363.1 hypothetical protein [Chloroflexota bacterium]NOG36454.1 hypothetical protein [Chloroflexota bacterium]